jgi:hypothetical protein
MNTKNASKMLLIAAALAAGLVSAARAGEDPTMDSPRSLAGQGLLGQTYSQASYGFVNLDGTPADAHALSYDYNLAVAPGFDTFANLRALRSQNFGGGRVKAYDLNFGARYHRLYRGVTPYWELGFGWTFAKAPGFDDNSLVWSTAAGVELPVASGASVTPYVKYSDAIDFRDGDGWHYGVRANYWLNPRSALVGSIERRLDESTEYRLGVTFNF